MPPTRCGLALAAALALSGCFSDAQHAMLPDTLYFSPGTVIQYRGKTAKLYGTDQCVQGVLTGNSCLIFPPHRPTGKAIVITDAQVQELEVVAKRDPENPTHFLVVDHQGHTLLSTSGHHEGMANIGLTH